MSISRHYGSDIVRTDVPNIPLSALGLKQVKVVINVGFDSVSGATISKKYKMPFAGSLFSITKYATAYTGTSAVVVVKNGAGVTLVGSFAGNITAVSTPSTINISPYALLAVGDTVEVSCTHAGSGSVTEVFLELAFYADLTS